jgi:2-C-methyl-D-erythritol 4-phosphate cytidylyltransferase
VLQGLPLIVHCLKSLGRDPRVCWVQPVIAEGDLHFQKAVAGHSFSFELLRPVSGGSERGQSMANGLAALPAEMEWVAVHDAARPIPSAAMLREVFDAAKRYGAAVPGLEVHDTIKQVDAAGRIVATLDRKSLRAVQTPQVARRSLFERAVQSHRATLGEFTDDAALLEAAGFDVYVSRGDPYNRKITTPEDFEWLSGVLAAGKTLPRA